MVYSSVHAKDILKPEEAIINLVTTPEKRDQYVLEDKEVVQLAKWACIIQDHYKCHMDIEWAKDGEDGKMYIVQARPETVHSNKKQNVFKQYTLLEKGIELCSGAGIGTKVVSGKARLLNSPAEISKINEGDILVTERTDPDWDPILKKATAIIRCRHQTQSR